MFAPSLFRAYDLRGTVPDQLTPAVAYAYGVAFVRTLTCESVAVGRDSRLSGPELETALICGIQDAGARVTSLGVVPTEVGYFASQHLHIPAIMVTASHNPAEWNGLKSVGPDGQAFTRDDVLGQIYRTMEEVEQPGEYTPETYDHLNLNQQYIEYLQEHWWPKHETPMELVVSANHGPVGSLVDRLTSSLPVIAHRILWDADGSFPQGTPDPLLPRNQAFVRKELANHEAYAAFAWDADADRIFLFDEKGNPFRGAYIARLIIEHLSQTHPDDIYMGEPRVLRPVRDAVVDAGGTYYLTKTGHGFIKQAMREHKALFAGENSAHYFYRDFAYCDSGLITFCILFDLLSQWKEQGITTSAVLAQLTEQYPCSDELNFIVEPGVDLPALLVKNYQGEVDTTEGISLSHPDGWRCNVRASQNEPVIRLVIEATSAEQLQTITEELVTFFTSAGSTLRNDHD